jgi:hypothetical protein
MISALWSFLTTQAFPRTRGIVVASETALAGALAALLGIYGSRIALGATSTIDIVLALISYAAIGFGFSVAGLTIVLTAPDHDFAHELAWSDPAQGPGTASQPPRQNSYANLLFIFAWTGIAHWTVIVAGFALLVGLGKDTPLLGPGASDLHRAGVALVAFVAVYAVELFLVTVITIAQAGSAYIVRLQRKRPGPGDKS